MAHLAYPVLVLWPVVVCSCALRVFALPADPVMRKAVEVALFLISAVPVVITLMLLEKKLPYWADRQPSREDVRNDLTHLAMCWFAIVQ